ncbi:MAG TPA: sigma-54 dependent transcriptional regulator [bacterium]|nr:sigma-54 dependent transcriptional regulator [bacterium]
MAQIIIIDDELLLAKALARSLTQKGHDCSVAGTAEDGLRLLKSSPPDVVLLDLQLPGMSGLQALAQIMEFDPGMVVIIATAYGTVASAVEAMRAGAADFLRKPLDLEEVGLTIERALSNARLRERLRYYEQRDVELSSADQMLGDSEAMQRLLAIANRLSQLNISRAGECPAILITGETGTGKDTLARYIHYRSKFASQPFIDVNCPTLPRGLEEAELFGYERGAFTGAHKSKRGLFEAAEGGTIFLNEIGDLPMEAQVKLLQVIERRTLRHIGGLRDVPVNVRIMAATNRDLPELIQRGGFREDLYHRLHHFSIVMPPLRDRGHDVILLANHFLQRSRRKYGTGPLAFSQAAKDLLVCYRWPGNLRELDHVIDRTVALSHGPEITPEDLGLPNDSRTVKASGDSASPQRKTLDELEREAIIQALTVSGGNVSEAARLLGIGREALRYRIQKHRLDNG